MANFLDTFLEWIGESDVPPIYFRWAALSVVGACLANRVYSHKVIGSRTLRVVPNLYVLLVGPSGNGKSLAISSAVGLLRRVLLKDKVNLFEGKMTAPAMYQAMNPIQRISTGHVICKEAPYIYVVNDELANDIGMNEYADQFIKSLTRMYLGEPFKDATITRGTVSIDGDYCCNYIGATTKDWLGSGLNRSAILGGFFARVVVVTSGYTGIRVDDPVKAENWDELDAELIKYIQYFLQCEGLYTLTSAAVELDQKWRKSRPIPREGDPLAPTRRREYDLMRKLALIFAVMRRSDHTIDCIDLENAFELVEEASVAIPELANFVALSPQAIVGQEILSYVQQHSKVSGTTLSKVAYAKGMDAYNLRRLVDTWVEAGLVKVTPQGKGHIYEYIGK